MSLAHTAESVEMMPATGLLATSEVAAQREVALYVPGRVFMKKCVLITGASGNLGSKLAVPFADEFEVRLTDIRPAEGVTELDLTQFDHSWGALFEGVDAIIHFGGEPSPYASWERLHAANVVGTGNILRAAKQFGVPRVALASSNHVMGGYRYIPEKITSKLTPMPLQPYAITKLIGEEMGRAFVAETGGDFLACRIGNIPRGDNPPGKHLGAGTWWQDMWLSNRDFVEAFRCAVTAAPFGFQIANFVSNNPGMRWDLTEGEQAIGYVPQDGAAAIADDVSGPEEQQTVDGSYTPEEWLGLYYKQMAGATIFGGPRGDRV